MYSIYLSFLNYIMSNTNNHKFSSIWRCNRCCNDAMNNVDCVIKRDVYSQKMQSCYKNIRGISVFVLKISVVLKKKKKKTRIIGVIAWLFR